MAKKKLTKAAAMIMDNMGENMVVKKTRGKPTKKMPMKKKPC